MFCLNKLDSHKSKTSLSKFNCKELLFDCIQQQCLDYYDEIPHH